MLAEKNSITDTVLNIMANVVNPNCVQLGGYFWPFYNDDSSLCVTTW